MNTRLIMKNNLRTEKAKRYIAKNYHKKLLIDELAGICHMGNSNFSRVFFMEYGLTVQEYIKQYRLNVAKKLLLTTKEKIDYIAKFSGFHDKSYFFRSFKNETSLTPSEFREFNSLYP